jgi:hypothetical protein
MMARWFLGDLPNWIQAVAAVCLVALTGLTLIVLRRYAADTKKIADASASQTENSQMPFLAVAAGEPGEGWAIYNQGFGPAINIRYSRYDRGYREMQSIAPLAPRGRHTVHNEYVNALGKVFEIQYESLSGLKYSTLITWDETGAAVARFQKP